MPFLLRHDFAYHVVDEIERYIICYPEEDLVVVMMMAF